MPNLSRFNDLNTKFLMGESIMRALFACLVAVVACSACSTVRPSPVGPVYSDTYSINDIEVRLTEGDRVPNRYDASVMEILEDDERISERQQEEFRNFAASHGGLTDENAGELFLEYLVWDRLGRLLPGYYRGEVSSALNVEIVSTTFPNTATMLLVGEVIGTSYEFTLTDQRTGDVVVETTERIAPIVQPSAGSGGGLLGIALRGGNEHRHLLDLQRMADAIANEITDIIARNAIHSSDVDKIAVHAIPAPSDPESDSDMRDPVSP